MAPRGYSRNSAKTAVVIGVTSWDSLVSRYIASLLVSMWMISFYGLDSRPNNTQVIIVLQRSTLEQFITLSIILDLLHYLRPCNTKCLTLPAPIWGTHKDGHVSNTLMMNTLIYCL